MQIDIEAKNFDLTPALSSFINEKIGKLDKFLKSFPEGSVRARVEVARSSKHHRSGDIYYAETNLYLPGKTLRAEDEGPDVRVSVNRVSEKLQREIEKYKRK